VPLHAWYNAEKSWSRANHMHKLRSLMYRVTHGLVPTYLTDLCEKRSNTRLCSASRRDYILPRSRLRCVDSNVHSLYRHRLHGTICLHIFVVVPLCRSFYLNSSLTFSSPLSLLSSIIPYSPHTLFRFKSFFLFIFTFI